jgi:UDP-glucose 4-epimerase
MAQLLITGGAGFIGSHTCLVLLEAGHRLVVLDNFSNSSPESLRRVLELAGLAPGDPRLATIAGDIRSSDDLERAFQAAAQPIEAVVHFAGLKAVGESVQDPLRYWDVNVAGSRALLAAMRDHDCRVIVFSSTSTVYGQPDRFPLLETDPVAPLHPYAQTKLAVEQLLEALADSEPGWRVSILRYFNPVGAHPSGRIGEDPRGIPNNLFPFITQVAAGRQRELRIFGNDYPTRDGTGIRDYLHVMDLAEAHALALERLLAGNVSLPTLNVGTGRGQSVLEVVQAFEAATGLAIPRVVLPRRPGDVPCLQASPEKAVDVLGWRARRTLAEMCRDGWAWQQANPQGYGKG